MSDHTKDQNLKLEKAIFAGGCFWCMQPPYDKLKGVVKTVVGYIGGKTENPTYEDVCDGVTGHAEAIEVTFDPSIVTYDQVLDLFWKNIDPTAFNRQFCDVGDQYRTAVFYYGDKQKKAAEESKKKWDESGRFGRKIVTQIAPAGKFYAAEDYHQQFYLKNPVRYDSYHAACGREQYLAAVWSKKD